MSARWETLPRTQGPIRRCRIGDVRIELMPVYIDNDREWRATYYVMHPGKMARSWFGCSATGAESDVRARAEAAATALIALRGGT